jgi:hypothetical protein
MAERGGPVTLHLGLLPYRAPASYGRMRAMRSRVPATTAHRRDPGAGQSWRTSSISRTAPSPLPSPFKGEHVTVHVIVRPMRLIAAT